MSYEIVAPICGEHCENMRLYGEHKANCGWDTDAVGAENEYATLEEAEAGRQQLIKDFDWQDLRIREVGDTYPLK